jgi:hypothetical protein
MCFAQSKNRQGLPNEKCKIALEFYLPHKSIASSRGNDDPLQNQNTARSRLVWNFVCEQCGRLWLEFWPLYAPELSPVEYPWSH